MARRNTSRETPLEELGLTRETLDDLESRFVEEFMVDRDPYLAATRAGVARVDLKRRVTKWMSDPKIVRAILAKTDGMELNKMISPQRIVAGFIDIAFDKSSNTAARNTALRELAAITGLGKADEDDEKNKSGVIMVPVAGTLEDWKNLAAQSQQKLKDDVRK